MKVAQHTKYHKKNITVTITEIEKPKISSEQVLVRVKAAGVNPLDNMISRGEVKLIVPYSLPQTAGNEFVGVVEEVGNQVRNFKLGERVFARLRLDSIGAFAEYIAVDSEALAKVPEYLSDVEAAAIPLTALTIIRINESRSRKDNFYFRWYWWSWWNGNSNCKSKGINRYYKW